MKTNKNTNWRVKERIETLDLPLAEDHDHPVWVKRNPDIYEREVERINRAERREQYRNRWYR